MRTFRFWQAIIVLAAIGVLKVSSPATAADNLSWSVTPGTKLRYRVHDSHTIKHSDARLAGELEVQLTVAVTAVRQQADVTWFQLHVENFAMQRRLGGRRSELDTAKSVVKDMDTRFESGKDLLAVAQGYCNRQELLRVGLDGVEIKLHFTREARPIELATNGSHQMIDEVVAAMLPLIFVPLDRGELTRGRNWYVVEDEEAGRNRLVQLHHQHTVQSVTSGKATLVEVAIAARGAEKREDVLFGEPGTSHRQGTYRFNATGHYLESLEITAETAASNKNAGVSSSDARQLKIELLDKSQGAVPKVVVPDDQTAHLIDRSQRKLSDKATYAAGVKAAEQSLATAKTASPAPAAPATPTALILPDRPPEGFLIATKDMSLLPGMPIQVFHGRWQDGEIIKADDDSPLVAHKLRADREPFFHKVNRKQIAVAETTLKQGREQPESFQPNYRVLANGRLPLQKDWVPVNEDTPLVPGTPLHRERADRWVAVIVVSPPENGRVSVMEVEGLVRSPFARPITELAIEKSHLEVLRQPGTDTFKEFARKLEALKSETRVPPGADDTLKEFARRLETMRGETNIPRLPRPPRQARTYAITQPLPPGMERLSNEVTVTKDAKIQIEWGRRWRSATVLEDSPSGAVMVRWDDFGKWDEPVSRDSLIIDGKVQAALTRETKPLSKAKVPDPAPVGAEDLELVLESFGDHKIKVAKVVMEITGFDLKDAKETVEAAPIVLKDQLSKADAERLQQQIESAGGKAKVQTKGR